MSELLACEKKILSLVNFRDRSVSEIRSRLSKADFSPDIIEEAIVRCIQLNLLDDKRFAEQLLYSRLSQNKGKQLIKGEFEEHELFDYSYLLDSLDYDGECQRAFSYLRKHPSRSKNPRNACYAKLLRVGFTSEVSSFACKKYFSESNC